ncbi:dehydrase and lipid transport-domain-containing protein [Umbelopsis sp. PMI_123]|nr:dehydrase and lipid transport-domain-containing protein [Umbelopsis sp. PMI_123]
MQAIRSSRWCLPSTFQYRTFFSLPKVVPDIFDSRKVYSERKLLNYSQAQVYDVVSNVTDYHQFIPFCSHSKVFSTKAVPSPSTPGRIIMQAELGVGFNLFNEKYMSKVTCDKPSLVKAESADATMFKELTTVWRFTPNVNKPGIDSSSAIHHPSCWVDFSIAFEFASPLHAHASGVFFDKVSTMMMSAFIERCAKVYGKR